MKFYDTSAGKCCRVNLWILSHNDKNTKRNLDFPKYYYKLLASCAT